MKKIGFLVMGLVVSHFVFSQNVQFGIKGGVNLSSVNDEDRVPDAKVKPRVGFNVGGLAHFHINKSWAIQPELVYSKEGAQYKDQFLGKTDLNYINVPVLLQYMITGFRIETGPEMKFLTSAKYQDANNNETDKGDIRKTAVSWAFGLGYVTKAGFGIDARYNLGLSNLYKEGVYGPNVAARSRVGQIGIFYQFKH